MRKIKIIANGQAYFAELYETPTANEIYHSLPLSAPVSTWGEELYFSLHVKMRLEPDARELVEHGDLGYWPVGSAFCIFFGPTPVSTGEQPQAASPVNVFGKMKGDYSLLREVRPGVNVIVDAAE